MNEKVESTIVFDGLVEGRLPEIDEIEEKLRQWVGFAADLGVKFNLDLTGSSFSLLPETRAFSCKPLGTQPEDSIKQLLEQLLELLPEEQRQSVFSTLRTAEYQPGLEVQTIYAVGPLGQIQVESRTVNAKTKPPPTPVSKREIVRLSIYGLVISLVIIGVVSIFFDIPALFGQLAGTVAAVKAEDIEIKLNSFEEFLTVDEKKVESIIDEKKGNSLYNILILSIKRTDAFPKTEKQLQEAFEKSGNFLNRRLAIETLARGFVRCELFDKHKKYMGNVSIRIRELQTEETMKVVLPMKIGEKKFRLSRVEFRF